MNNKDPNPTATRLIEGVWNRIETYESPEVFLSTFAAVPREHGLLYAVWRCDWEICNGGFRQFFDNSAGVLAPEAVEGFIAVGQPRLADLVTQAMAKLPVHYDRTSSARWAVLDLLPSGAFDDLDNAYYQLREIDGGGFDLAIEQFAKKAAK
jgi:uncharacterized protein DUF4375